MQRPLEKPPADYKDPSEFEGAKEKIDLEKLREESAIQKALDETKKDDGPEAAWVREREAEVDDLFNELAAIEDKPTEDEIRLNVGAGRDTVTTRLERRWAEAKKVGDPTAFLAVASEVLRRFKDVGGIKELEGDRVIMETGKTARFREQTAVLERFIKERTLGSKKKEVADDGVWASSPPPKETHEAAEAVVNPNAETQPDLAAIKPEEQDWFDKGDRGDIKEDTG